MTPQFPQFKKLELSDRSTIQQLTSPHLPYSDYNFTSLWSWNTKDEAEFSILNDNLVIKFNDYVTGEPFYSYLGHNQASETVEQLLHLAQQEKVKLTLKLLPQSSITNELIDAYTVIEDIDNFDYIYSLQQLQECKGGDFEDMRNLRNRFTRRNTSIEVRVLDISKDTDRELVEQLNKQWEDNRGFRLDNEEEAIKRLLNSAIHFPLVSLVILVDKQPVAFSINEILNEEFAIAHFAKADTRYIGVYAYLMHAVATLLAGQGCKYLNYEQDLGLSGLRQAKRSFNPIYFLKKYSLTLNRTNLAALSG